MLWPRSLGSRTKTASATTLRRKSMPHQHEHTTATAAAATSARNNSVRVWLTIIQTCTLWIECNLLANNNWIRWEIWRCGQSRGGWMKSERPPTRITLSTHQFLQHRMHVLNELVWLVCVIADKNASDGTKQKRGCRRVWDESNEIIGIE